MLRRLAAVVVCVLLLAAVPTGSLYVTTLPTGADVWIDGTYVGRSPLVLGALVPGRHTLGLTKTGWDPLQLDVSVVAAQTTLSSTRLEPLRSGGLHALPGWIAIHGVVRTAQVDGRPMVPAKDGTIVVAAGTHELTARTPRGRVATNASGETITPLPASVPSLVMVCSISAGARTAAMNGATANVDLAVSIDWKYSRE